MKLRIKGNSIRLRLTKPEVSKILNGEVVQETLSFGGISSLRYGLEPSDEVDKIQACFENNHVRVLVPSSLATLWASTEQVSLLNEEQEPSILVEKDFFCLKPRSHETESRSEMFANPNEAHGNCGGVLSMKAGH